MSEICITDFLNKDDYLTIVEVGCNDGVDSLSFLNIFNRLKLYCFEPDYRAISKFKRNINDNRCRLFEMAVGSFDGYIDLHLSSGNPGGEWGYYGEWDKSSSIKKPKKHLTTHPWCVFKETRKVPIIKLDTWAKENKVNFIDFLWADVQGAERELIMGGVRTLDSKTKFFYTEYSEDEQYEGALNVGQIQKLLPYFEVVRVFEHDVLFRNKHIL